MEAHATAAALARPSTLGRLAQRVAIVGIGLAFLLTAYGKMGSRAEDTVAQADLSAIVPFVHAYGIEHDGYEGMTLEALRRDYSPSLDDATYTLTVRGADDFCVESTHAGRTWHVTAVAEKPSRGGCY